MNLCQHKTLKISAFEAAEIYLLASFVKSRLEFIKHAIIIRNMPEIASSITHSEQRRRHEESLEHYARGMECLLQAEESGFQDRRLLQEAADCLIESIRKNRRFVEPHIAMGYLLWLYNDPVWAMHYLEEALRLEPTHPDIHILIEKIKGRPLKPEELESIAFSEEGEPTSIEEDVNEALSELAQENRKAITPTINPHILARMEEKQVYWFNRSEELQIQVNRSRDLATKNRLREQLKPLRERAQQYRDALRISYAMIALSDQLLQDNQRAKQYLEMATKPMGAARWQEIQDQVDTLLDHCDSFADQLDQLEQQGIPLGSLATQYNQLLERLENLQALLARQT